MLARALVLVAPLVTGCLTVGSGNLLEEERSLGAFTKLQSSGSIDVTVGADPSGIAVVEADDNLLPFVETIIVGDTLEVRTRKSFVSSNPIRLRVGAPELEAVSVSGSGRVTANAIATDKFAASISGSGSVELAGQAKALDAAISGSGSLAALSLPVADADVSVSGSGTAKISVSDSLTANVSGSGSIRYAGDPDDVAQDVSGSGSVNPL